MRLDRTKVYWAEDEKEVFWRFEFKKVGDITGWWQFRKRPIDTSLICIGPVTEKEIKDFLKIHHHPLDEDDFIELELTMQKIWGKDLPNEDEEQDKED